MTSSLRLAGRGERQRRLRLGLTVYVGSRDAAGGQRTVGEIGGDARLLVLDVTGAASIAAAASQIDALDILVNNAGISGEDKTPDLEDVGAFRRIYLNATAAASGDGGWIDAEFTHNPSGPVRSGWLAFAS